MTRLNKIINIQLKINNDDVNKTIEKFRQDMSGFLRPERIEDTRQGDRDSFIDFSEKSTGDYNIKKSLQINNYLRNNRGNINKLYILFLDL